jgi:hypothetical protein
MAEPTKPRQVQMIAIGGAIGGAIGTGLSAGSCAGSVRAAALARGEITGRYPVLAERPERDEDRGRDEN